MLIDVTSYSFLTAITCFSVFIILFSIVRRKNRVVFHCGIVPLICLCILSVARTVCIVEFSFTHVVTINSVNWLYDGMGNTLQLFGSKITVGVLASVLWFSWTVTECLWFVYKIFASWQYDKQADPVTDPKALRLCRQITGGRASLVFTKRLSPYVSGFFRPTIYLPYVSFTEDELRYVLMHEWQHFKSKDQWKKSAVYIVSCLLWWNPLVYWLRSDLEQLLELQCDRKVLKQLPADERVSYLRMIAGFCDASLRSGESDKKSNEKKNVLMSEFVSLEKRRQRKKFRLIRQRVWLGMRYGQTPRRQKFWSVALCLIFILAFLASYTINIQPRYWPTEQDGPLIGDFPENSVLVENEDGTYTVIIDGKEWSTVSDRTDGPFASIPVIPFEN